LPQPAGPPSTDRLPLGPLLALLLTIVGTVAIRLRLLSMPLERTRANTPMRPAHSAGHPPYERLYNMKWPGTYYCYALFEAVLGQTIEGIHLGCWPST